MAAQKTSALPLSLVYGALIVYASLYPFGEWRDQGLMPWSFLTASLPRYWTGFDVGSNIAGYVPFGGLIALAVMRGPRNASGGAALVFAVVVVSIVSFTMEALQSYLPMRVASNVDFALNVSGGLLGALLAAVLERLGVLDRWSRIRARWFVPNAHGAIALLVLWPVALLFPASVPFGLGQVLERMEGALGDMLVATPFLGWLPVRDVELQPLVPGAELMCVMLGALVPCLLGFSVMNSLVRRAAFVVLMACIGVAASALSAALSFGPSHAWAWFGLPVQVGVGAAVIAALLLLPVSRRGAAALALLAIGIHLTVLNQAPTSAYFAQTLQTWEQGRFIRFHGIVQWLGWLWPYAALVYVLALASRSGRDS